VLVANDSHEEKGTPELLVKRVGFAPSNKQPATPLNDAHPGGFFIACTLFLHFVVKNACIVRSLCVIFRHQQRNTTKELHYANT